MNIFTYLKRHSVLATAIAVIAVVVMVVAGRVAARKGGEQSAKAAARQVTLVDVAAFRQDGSSIAANGTVESVAQADLRSQVSAPVSYIAASVGDSVYAGQTILELKNADIRARLDQARAALLLAQGQSETAAVSLGSARTSATDRARDAFAALDQAIRGQIDQFLFNSSGGVSSLASRVGDIQLVDRLHASRDDLSNYFPTLKERVDALSSASTDAELFAALAQAKSALAAASTLLDDVTVALNSVSKDTSSADAAVVNGWKSTAGAAKSSISGSSSAVTAADSALRNALTSRGTTADAGIASAEAGVKSLEAELAKTVIASPITGKIAAMPLRVGELASPGTLLATVVGGQGLQVKAYVSGDDLARIVKGAPALVQGTVAGTVAAVSPAVSAASKKAEVTISVSDSDASGLVVGQSVAISIKSPKGSAAAGSYFLPIQDVQIVPGDAYVFTVDDQGRAVRRSVTLGKVQGDFVEVTAGLEDDLRIATPVYGLEDGQAVDAAR
ncbi:MAG TPA: HlyD family efflux transporter periplasmic adaptor subunit [Candidatus Paceibacterota bacterium]|nr:HlyD family efflux transporter periplasmic adaptor subunit [Candidatus Paceibacterota bacterium]